MRIGLLFLLLASLPGTGSAVAQEPPKGQRGEGGAKGCHPFCEKERFEKEVDDLRNRLKIPGLSAVIVKDQKVGSS